MPNMKNRSRLVTMLAVAALGIATMAPAMAAPPDGIPPAQAENGVNGEDVAAENAANGAEKALAGQNIAAEHQDFANETVREIVTAFVIAVADWTECLSEKAAFNEGNAEGVNPLEDCENLEPELVLGNSISTALTIE